MGTIMNIYKVKNKTEHIVAENLAAVAKVYSNAEGIELIGKCEIVSDVDPGLCTRYKKALTELDTIKYTNECYKKALLELNGIRNGLKGRVSSLMKAAEEDSNIWNLKNVENLVNMMDDPCLAVCGDIAISKQGVEK